MIRLAVRVSDEHAELVLAELLELAPSGVEEVALPGGVTEYAVFGSPGELPALPDLRAAAGGALVEISTQEIADDWAERWREFHKPLVLGDQLTVRPPWEPPATAGLDIVIDPGQAFGTGAHATTRMCLELLLELDPSGPMVDLGCGSGVLGITGARRGFAPVVCLDNDPAAVAATLQNARANRTEIEVRRFDLRREPLPAADLVAANLLGPLLLRLAERLDPSRLPGTLIASGLLCGEADAVGAAFARRGLHEAARRERDAWAAVLLRSGAVS